MKRVHGILVTTFLFLLGLACVSSKLPTLDIEILARPVDFLADVKPILDSRCVVCHSCYNAACQLKLSSYEGVERGGSKIPVYSGSRLRAQHPTRLFFDAETTAEWRTQGFHSVIDSLGQSEAESTANDAIMLYLLEAKRLDPTSRGRYDAEATDLVCPANRRELGSFLARHPERGMPFGFPPLDLDDHAILSTWVHRGAAGPTPQQQNALTTPVVADAVEIDKWEAFLNRDDPKYAMTARYLYEHFFLAHIHFSESDSNAFFRLVRSATPPGEPISVIATVRPYDDPGVPEYYYRFRKIHSTLVHKTHMVVEFGRDTLARYRELFIDSKWLEPPHRMAFDEVLDANPFLVYAQIPPRVRYRFLLDHSEYMIRTFIRGPVCKGQIALNVIHDHFWVMFLDPNTDQTVLHPEFLIEQARNLRLPNERGSDEALVRAFSDEYLDRYVEFYKAKMRLYEDHEPEGPGIDAIWRGRRASDSPMLTIFRHFDSASVHKGVLGDLPRTLWVIDYPQLERIYYALVAGFDVFGNLSHQVNVRRYMDYLRTEGELNFLQFLPPDVRVSTFRSWYLGENTLEDTNAREIVTERATRVRYETRDPKREFLERIVNDHLLASTEISFDPVNYNRGEEPPPMPTSFATREAVMEGFRALTAEGTGFIKHVTGSGANVLFLRVEDYSGIERFVSIVINRWHDNVSSLLFEERRLDASKDTISFLPGPIGSYPNYFLDVRAEDIPQFFDMLDNFDGSPEYVEKFERFGVNRADPRFWELYDWFQAKAYETDPIRAGLFDLNRYHALATSQ